MIELQGYEIKISDTRFVWMGDHPDRDKGGVVIVFRNGEDRTSLALSDAAVLALPKLLDSVRERSGEVIFKLVMDAVLQSEEMKRFVWKVHEPATPTAPTTTGGREP